MGLIVPTEPVVLLGVAVVVGITVDPEVVAVVVDVGVEVVDIGVEVVEVEPVVNVVGEVTGDTVLVVAVFVVFVVGVVVEVVEVGATDPEVIVLVGAIAVVTTGLTAIGELTAVVPWTVAVEIFAVGETEVFTLGGGGAATLVGAATVGDVLVVEAAWDPDLLKKIRASMIPIKARIPIMSQTHQGQGYFWALSGGGLGACLILECLSDPPSQLGPLTVYTKG